MRLHWKRQGQPVEFIDEVKLPDFHMTTFIHEKATFQYPAGVWDQVEAHFFWVLTRNVSVKYQIVLSEVLRVLYIANLPPNLLYGAHLMD